MGRRQNRQLKSPCVDCETARIPYCRGKCKRLRCFRVVLSQTQIMVSCVLESGEIEKIIIDLTD